MRVWSGKEPETYLAENLRFFPRGIFCPESWFTCTCNVTGKTSKGHVRRSCALALIIIIIITIIQNFNIFSGKSRLLWKASVCHAPLHSLAFPPFHVLTTQINCQHISEDVFTFPEDQEPSLALHYTNTSRERSKTRLQQASCWLEDHRLTTPAGRCATPFWGGTARQECEWCWAWSCPLSSTYWSKMPPFFSFNNQSLVLTKTPNILHLSSVMGVESLLQWDQEKGRGILAVERMPSHWDS